MKVPALLFFWHITRPCKCGHTSRANVVTPSNTRYDYNESGGARANVVTRPVQMWSHPLTLDTGAMRRVCVQKQLIFICFFAGQNKITERRVPPVL